MKKNLIVLQEGSKDCGSAALLSIIRYYGGDISIDRLIELTKTDKDGTNFYNMSKAIETLGLIAKCYKVDDIEKLKEINVPFIAQLTSNGYNHFVVVYKINIDKVLIMDPARGKCYLDFFDFSNIWTGYIMLFEKKKNIICFKEEKVVNKLILDCLFSNKKALIFLFIIALIFTILSCLTSLYSQIIFDKVIDTNTNNLVIITFFFSILYIVKNITSFVRNYLIIYLKQKLDITIMLGTFSKIILLPYYYYKNKTTAEVLSRINDLSYVKNFLSKFIVTIFLDFLLFIISIFIIYNISSTIMFILLCIDLFYVGIFIIFNPILKNISRIYQENNSLINGNIIESVSSFETVKGLNVEDNIIFKFSKDYNKRMKDSYYSETINNIIMIIKDVVFDIGLLLINFICIKYVMDNYFTIGDYMTITFLSGYLIYPMKNLLDILDEFHYAKMSIKRVNNIFEIDDEKIYDENKIMINGNIVVKKLNYTFNNKYYVFNNLNLFIRDKDRVLILGESGSGKSTILKLFYKYYAVEREKIFINGYDINDYSLSDIRQNITYVSQNEMLFTGSIRNNILLGREVSETFFLNICKITYVDEIVKDSILGYDYILEENGINISGGQRQRIILARALLKNSKIIMIDEGFSQIDFNLERKILKNLFYYFFDKTFIIISHRKENMDLYSRVLKVNKGLMENLERGN